MPRAVIAFFAAIISLTMPGAFSASLLTKRIKTPSTSNATEFRAESDVRGLNETVCVSALLETELSFWTTAKDADGCDDVTAYPDDEFTAAMVRDLFISELASTAPAIAIMTTSRMIFVRGDKPFFVVHEQSGPQGDEVVFSLFDSIRHLSL